MILHMVCIKDTALDAFQTPFFVPSVGVAVRHFGDEVVNNDSPMFKHPEDYFLYKVGVFDTDTGIVESFDSKQIARALDYVKIN